jgi:hypothetical protein
MTTDMNSKPHIFYLTFDEFQHAFYPSWYKAQQIEANSGNFGTELAKLTFQKHSPTLSLSPDGRISSRHLPK